MRYSKHVIPLTIQNRKEALLCIIVIPIQTHEREFNHPHIGNNTRRPIPPRFLAGMHTTNQYMFMKYFIYTAFCVMSFNIVLIKTS